MSIIDVNNWHGWIKEFGLRLDYPFEQVILRFFGIVSSYERRGFSRWWHEITGNPMSEKKRVALRVGFTPSLKLEFHDSMITSMQVCWPTGNRMKEALGLMVMAERPSTIGLRGRIAYTRWQSSGTNQCSSCLAGYEDTNDAQRLSMGAAIRHVVEDHLRDLDPWPTCIIWMPWWIYISPSGKKTSI